MIKGAACAAPFLCDKTRKERRFFISLSPRKIREKVREDRINGTYQQAKNLVTEVIPYTLTINTVGVRPPASVRTSVTSLRPGFSLMSFLRRVYSMV